MVISLSVYRNTPMDVVPTVTAAVGMGVGVGPILPLLDVGELLSLQA
jgi:hypothetical protein